MESREVLSEPADLFEFVELRCGPVPRRVDPKTRGVMARYFMSFTGGFMSRMGGVVELFNNRNTSSSTLGQEGNEFVLKVLGVPVLSATKKAVKVPALEVGSPEKSYIVMYSGEQKYYVYVTPTGKIGVRKTPPPTVKSE
jgi:hypothetical protein